MTLTQAPFTDPFAETAPPPAAPPRVLTEAEWVPDDRCALDRHGAYVVHVRWRSVTWTCVRPMVAGYGNRDGNRLIVTPAWGYRGHDADRLLRRIPRDEFLRVVDAAIERELEAGAADYAADCREAGE